MKKKANTDSQPINGGLAGEVVSEDYEGWLEQAEIEASRRDSEPGRRQTQGNALAHL